MRNVYNARKTQNGSRGMRCSWKANECPLDAIWLKNRLAVNTGHFVTIWVAVNFRNAMRTDGLGNGKERWLRSWSLSGTKRSVTKIGNHLQNNTIFGSKNVGNTASETYNNLKRPNKGTFLITYKQFLESVQYVKWFKEAVYPLSLTTISVT